MIFIIDFLFVGDIISITRVNIS